MCTGKTSDNSENETKPTPSYNELEAAQSLVGMKEPQPKSGNIHKLRSYDAKQTTESKDIVEIKPQQVKPNVRCNLAVHRLVTPFVIWQPIQRPRLLERVYKPMHTSH